MIPIELYRARIGGFIRSRGYTISNSPCWWQIFIHLLLFISVYLWICLTLAIKSNFLWFYYAFRRSLWLPFLIGKYMLKFMLNYTIKKLVVTIKSFMGRVGIISSIVMIIMAITISNCEPLSLDGDVETNPGPVTFNKKVFASFSQGNSRFGNSAGVQCTLMHY